MIVNQLLPAVHYGDAIGDEALFIQKWIQETGAESRIFCMQSDAQVADRVTHWREFARYDTAQSLTILHYAVPSPLNHALLNAKGKKIIIYHNITPSKWLIGYGKELVHIANEGRRQLRELAHSCDLALGDSEFNCHELSEMGFSNPQVLPICYDFHRLDGAGSAVIERMFDDDFTNLIFVGRVTPNKAHEDLIRVYCCFKRYVRERSRLFIVGRFNGFMKYYYQLQRLLESLKLGDVYFTGHVELHELISYYRLANVFLGMSEHEGFCVPLLEAMHMQVPIVAYATGAIPGTLQGAGVLLTGKKPLEIAELCELLSSDKRLRDQIIHTQNAVKRSYEEQQVKKLFFGLMEPLTGG